MITGKNGHGIRVPIFKTQFTGNEEKYVSECIATGWVSSAGEFVERFEREFAKYIGVKYSTSACNGTCALHLALLSLGVGRGDEVIVPDFTFAATASAVMHAGAKPVLVDIDPITLNIDPVEIEKNITKKTKAIIPVHLYGRPAPMEDIMEIAERHGLLVIEDAAEAHGAMIGSMKVGSFGNAAIFSFYGNKIITTGEGGMVVSNDGEAINRASLLKNHGMRKEKRYWHDVVGYNYRLTNVQAAIGLAQLEKIEEKIELKRHVAKCYDRLFSSSGFILPSEENGTRNVYWLYWVMQASDSDTGKIMEKLASKGIESRPFFYPLSTMPPFFRKGLKNSVNIYKRGLCLPSYGGLTEKQQEFIASVILH